MRDEGGEMGEMGEGWERGWGWVGEGKEEGNKKMREGWKAK